MAKWLVDCHDGMDRIEQVELVGSREKMHQLLRCLAAQTLTRRELLEAAEDADWGLARVDDEGNTARSGHGIHFTARKLSDRGGEPGEPTRLSTRPVSLTDSVARYSN